MLKLYHAPGSCSLASHIVLAEAGASYELVRVDLAAGQQRDPDYLRVNPKGRVPALVTPDGVLTETPAILSYISAIHPAAGLMPTSAYEAARCQSFNSYFCSTVHIAHAHRMRGTRWADEPEAIVAMQRKVPQTMFESLQLIEEALGAGPWMLAATYSVCDPYLFRVVTWAEGDGVDLARLPRILDHRRRMVERPGVRRAFAEGAA